MQKTLVLCVGCCLGSVCMAVDMEDVVRLQRDIQENNARIAQSLSSAGQAIDGQIVPIYAPDDGWNDRIGEVERTNAAIAEGLKKAPEKADAKGGAETSAGGGGRPNNTDVGGAVQRTKPVPRQNEAPDGTKFPMWARVLALVGVGVVLAKMLK